MAEVLLVDGSNLARRNFHGQNLSTSGGIQTGLIYGVINSLLSIQKDIQAETVIVVWDTPSSSAFRKELYPMYKAGRNKVDDGYYVQLDNAKQLLTLMGVAQAESTAAEADDIIGYLAKVTFADKLVDVLSGDKDFYSLIDDRISVFNPTQGWIAPGKDGTIPLKESQKIINIRPDQMTDYKALVGDKSDNIPGANQFGISAAKTFFENGGSVEKVLSGVVNLDGLRSAAIQGLLQARPFLELFKQVVTIDINQGKVELPTRPDIDNDTVQALFDLYEFKQFKVFEEKVYRIGGVPW